MSIINAELHVVGGKHAGQVIPLNRPKFLIGREQDCQLRPNSELVSRHHCVFTTDDFAVRVRDLGSTNGTLVNDERIQKEVVLQPDDRVLVGSLEFSVRINEQESGDNTGEISVKSEETLVAGGTETLTEMTTLSMPIGSDTTLLRAIPTESGDESTPVADSAAGEAVSPEATAEPAMLIPQMPMGGTGDTTVMAPPMQVPGQPFPQMPQAEQPMYGAYPYQPVPGQMPQMYPPGFPGQVPPVPFPYPQQVEQPPAADTTAGAPTMPSVTLPDPSETGAKDAPPKPKSAESGAAEEEANSGADAIIKQYMQRRPGG
jgi:pSer/pThr/pTyr-binding forkhead associated (FHA) protein